MLITLRIGLSAQTHRRGCGCAGMRLFLDRVWLCEDL